MRKIEDIRYSEQENGFLDISLPTQEDFDVIIWFHGGGLEAGSRKAIGGFAEELIQKGFAIVSPEYRLYPKAQFPDFIEDAARAVRYTLDHIAEYGNAKRILIGGSSAGAYLTLMLAFDRHYLCDAGVDRKRISGYLSDSAQITTHYNVLRERGLDTRLERMDEAAVLYHLNDRSDFGNLLLVCYREDIPCRPEQNKLFYADLTRLCPDSKVELCELPGGHCNGTQNPNLDGSYDFNTVLLNFLGSDRDGKN